MKHTHIKLMEKYPPPQKRVNTYNMIDTEIASIYWILDPLQSSAKRNLPSNEGLATVHPSPKWLNQTSIDSIDWWFVTHVATHSWANLVCFICFGWFCKTFSSWWWLNQLVKLDHFLNFRGKQQKNVWNHHLLLMVQKSGDHQLRLVVSCTPIISRVYPHHSRWWNLAGFLNRINYPPWKLTWNLKMMVSNRNLLFQVSIFGCHVSFRECT